MKKTNSAKGAFHRNLSLITKKRIASMQELDTDGDTILLREPATGFYVVLNNRDNHIHHATHYSDAERYFHRMADQ